MKNKKATFIVSAFLILLLSVTAFADENENNQQNEQETVYESDDFMIAPEESSIELMEAYPLENAENKEISEKYIIKYPTDTETGEILIRYADGTDEFVIVPAGEL